ncbi:hypothetical protein PENTCL1PPCAC_17080 [Pristionchus entomophagus]|uniref:Amidase domain-containing protein n=1 Tax=Pristionchus entomophagus TaxID=358040 RepID=A0AAV5TKT2_9BILA|nr:hypothetical protein PENTCL1PPCAC_17080 [Pristionchus entomophagus]
MASSILFREISEFLEAVDMLGAKGHDLVPFSLGNVTEEACKGIFTTTNADGGNLVPNRLVQEPLTPIMEPLRSFLHMLMWVKKLLGWMFKLRGDKNTADMFFGISNRAIDIQKGIDRVYACRKRIVKKMRYEKIELILCPSTLSPAMPHSLPLISVMTTLLWNVMDWPAGVVKTGSWTERDEEELESYEDKGLVESGMKRGCRNSVGLRLSVQVVAPAFRDEMVLRVMLDRYDEMKKRETLAAD